MKVLFVITARGGSKGVPRKNIRKIGGLPLVAYKIISAQKCKYEKRIIVSTDDEEIAEVSRQYGAEVPFMRPEELSGDVASSIDVIDHAMNWVEKNDTATYEYICMLEPSSPFSTFVDLNKALDLVVDNKADTLLGMKKVEVNTVFINTLDKDGKLSYFYEAIKNMSSVRRQDQVDEYTMNGCMYIARWDYFKKNRLFHSNNSIPYIMEQKSSIEIDSMLDYEVAQLMVDKGLIDLSFWQ